ncbi:MAG: P27 family phage terminase small subunit [Mogibacterium sp.]|nr:P27 family phage terminase small subunit [Mogibacterium sp.]
MKKKTWKTNIKNACLEAGTYQNYFDHVIDALAGILELRDAAEDQYQRDVELDGTCQMVIEQTNKSGFTNRVKNPLVTLIDDLNKTALAYWKELGLTPAGLKRLNEVCFDKKKEIQGNGLLEALRAKQEKENG